MVISDQGGHVINHINLIMKWDAEYFYFLFLITLLIISVLVMI